jgi:hypothetical protein
MAKKPLPETRAFKLTDQPYIEFTVRAYRSNEDLPNGGQRGVTLFSFQDTCTDVHDDGDHIGAVVGAIGGWMVQDKRRVIDAYYIIRPQEVWDSFQEALESAGSPFSAMKEEEHDEQTKILENQPKRD